MFHLIRQIFEGKTELDERLKYQMICAMIGSVHLIFMIVFFYFGFLFPAVYNVLIVLFYIGMQALIARNSRFTSVFVAVFLEIITHSAIVTLYFGWEGGFINYMIPLIPMAFYSCLTLDYIRKKILMPVVSSLIVFTVFFSVLATTDRIGCLSPTPVTESFLHGMFYFNSFMVLMFFLTTSVLFSIEIRYMQMHLENENVSLLRMANFDPLTRLLNRRSMNVVLKQVLDETEGIEGSEPFCILMADIDDFKQVNDTYGHSKGDEVLVEVAHVLQSNVREQDKVCRWGGEEMLILLRSDMEVARSVAQRICSDMASTSLNIGDDVINVTLTLGVSEYKDGESIRSLIEAADQRLYRGKRSGKNCVVWN